MGWVFDDVRIAFAGLGDAEGADFVEFVVGELKVDVGHLTVDRYQGFVGNIWTEQRCFLIFLLGSFWSLHHLFQLLTDSAGTE